MKDLSNTKLGGARLGTLLSTIVAGVLSASAGAADAKEATNTTVPTAMESYTNVQAKLATQISPVTLVALGTIFGHEDDDGCETFVVDRSYVSAPTIDCVDRTTGENIECQELPQAYGHMYGCTGCDGSFHYVECSDEWRYQMDWIDQGCEYAGRDWAEEVLADVAAEVAAEGGVVEGDDFFAYYDHSDFVCTQTLEYTVCYDESVPPPVDSGCTTDCGK